MYPNLTNPPNPEGRSTRDREDREGDTSSADDPQRQPFIQANTSQPVAVPQRITPGSLRSPPVPTSCFDGDEASWEGKIEGRDETESFFLSSLYIMGIK